jgi:hypothetical protein
MSPAGNIKNDGTKITIEVGRRTFSFNENDFHGTLPSPKGEWSVWRVGDGQLAAILMPGLSLVVVSKSETGLKRAIAAACNKANN